MRHLPTLAGALLGLLFVLAGLVMLLGLAPEPPAPPEGSYMALFMGAFVPSGYLTFVKVLEVVGGVLVAVPKTRGFGLLVLAPIVVNIVAFHVFITEGAGLADPMLLVIVALTLVCLAAERKPLLALMVKA